ncbi:MAG: rRNA pseudouridine synthase [Treponema sp.]|nr:rRNA pseudouridine synthase [Treponema sp.]
MPAEAGSPATPDAAAPALRLQVYLARCGISSRRAAERLIAEGRVAVNGAVVTAQGLKVTARDTVLVDGRPARPETRTVYLLLNKPAGYLCASSDPRGRPLALSLLPPGNERLFSVGRLDLRSCGLIIFTNDGEFASKAGHPRSGLEKEYLVESTVPIPGRMVSECLKGVYIDGVLYKAKSMEKLGPRSLRVVLVEGKNREIRRLFAFYHLHVDTIRRVRIGPVTIDGLAEGSSRSLSAEEAAGLLGAHVTQKEEHDGHSD